MQLVGVFAVPHDGVPAGAVVRDGVGTVAFAVIVERVEAACLFECFVDFPYPCWRDGEAFAGVVNIGFAWYADLSHEGRVGSCVFSCFRPVRLCWLVEPAGCAVTHVEWFGGDGCPRSLLPGDGGEGFDEPVASVAADVFRHWFILMRLSNLRSSMSSVLAISYVWCRRPQFVQRRRLHTVCGSGWRVSTTCITWLQSGHVTGRVLRWLGCGGRGDVSPLELVGSVRTKGFQRVLGGLRTRLVTLRVVSIPYRRACGVQQVGR